MKNCVRKFKEKITITLERFNSVEHKTMFYSMLINASFGWGEWRSRDWKNKVLDTKMPILGGEAPNARVLQNFSFIVTSINWKTDLSFVESNRVDAGFCNELEVFICQVSFAYPGLTLFGPTGIIYDLI